jgi:presenilin 1
MILSALTVVYVNTEETVEAGAEAMADAYQVWKIDSDGGSSTLATLGLSLANGLVMVSVMCMMTFVIVLLYRYECMKCLIGYMVFCSSTLLGIMGGNVYYVAIQIYNLPVDKLSYFFSLWNFAVVGVIAVFYMKGVPKYVTQGYLICTSVILAWHLDYFDEYTTWTLLFMLALYDLCAVLTPCGPLKALVNLMSREDAPEMPGLLYEAELPPEARRPGVPKNSMAASSNPPSTESAVRQSTLRTRAAQEDEDGSGSGVWDNRSSESGPVIEIPLAVARVYNLAVLDIPTQSKAVLGPQINDRGGSTPLLNGASADEPMIPETPTPTQLMAEVIVRLPTHGGRIEKVKRSGKTMFLERDRFGTAKRLLWVDRLGRVFAEASDGEEESAGDEKNSIRLGLGDFIFYSVMVGKAAQYSFTAFAACMLVILAGLGGTLVLLSVYHHALPALPISIFLGVFFYVSTRIFVQPWVEAVLYKPYYV